MITSVVLEDFHIEMGKLGLSNAVMHNRVASGQREIAPIFALKNVSADLNALCQDMRLRTRSHFVASQKPFAGRT